MKSFEEPKIGQTWLVEHPGNYVAECLVNCVGQTFCFCQNSLIYNRVKGYSYMEKGKSYFFYDYLFKNQHPFIKMRLIK